MVVKVGTEPDPRKRIRQKQGTKIRKARAMRGWSIAEFADKVGATVGAVSHWETGRYSPRPAMQVAIAKTLDVPWSFIFGLDDEVAA